MGLFDYVRYGAKQYQTKSFDEPYMDRYEIRDDGSLWREAYDVEDRSDPNAEGLFRLRGRATRVNERWERVPDFTGEIYFYGDGEWSAYFVRGELKHMENLAPSTSEG